MKTCKRMAALVLMLLMMMSIGTFAAEVSVRTDVEWGFENGPFDNYSPWAANQVGSSKLGSPYIHRGYSQDAQNVHSGTRSLRLMNDGNNAEVTTVSVYLSLLRPAMLGTETNGVIPANMSSLLEGFVKVAELSEGSYVHVQWFYSKLNSNTGYPVTIMKIEDDTNKAWQKFSYAPNWTRNGNDYCYLRLELVGKGTVYFDDIFCGFKDNICRNGDFEFGDAQTVPTGWTFKRVTTSVTPAWNTDAFVVQESDGNRYLTVKNTTTASPAKAYYLYTPIDEIAGAKYICTVRYKTTSTNAGDSAPKIYFGPVSQQSAGYYDTTQQCPFTWEKVAQDADGWATFRGTCTMPESTDDFYMYIVYPSYWGTESYYDAIYCSIDNTPVLTKADDGTVTATSHVVALADRPSALFTAAYRKDANGNLCLVNLSSVSTETVAAGQTQKLEKSITLPEDGNEYVVRAFLWDGISTLGAQTASVTLAN